MSGIKDVAKRAGVSISTVSNVLNKSKYVSPELVKRVEDAVKELSYEVNPIARSMKSNKSGTIGVITEDMCGVFYPYVVKGINSVAMEKGYQIIICDTQGTYGDREAIKREQQLFRRLFASRVDGILFVSSIPNEMKEKYFAGIKKQANQYKKIPIVSLERDFTSVGIDSVYFDGFDNTKRAVQHLIDCGCKKIGHITGPTGMQIAQERIQGYKSCMEDNGLSYDDKMIVFGDYSHQSGYMAMRKLLYDVPDIDGVFCGNDQMAIGALKVLKECGRRVPEDIKLMGYDDVFISSVVEPSISTFHIQKRHAGIEAAKMLFERIENPEDEKHVARGLKMEGRLVVRKSTVATAPEDWILSDW
ncbi:LacI family transcriptional regulator [Blautia schinkii]|nr:LacI family transcriptional regulator [Blautia schinkii]